jgi:SAM-dependent methyltransferase
VRKQPITPAAYSSELVPVLGKLVAKYAPKEGGGTLAEHYPYAPARRLLDPMSGPGLRLNEIAAIGGFEFTGTDIERGYFKAKQAAPGVVWGDSTKMVFQDETFEAAVVSPPYPNGVSDDFIALDGSVRHTYAHRLRMHLGEDYRLHKNNSGGMNPRRSQKALETFYEIHVKVWAEVFRVLVPGGVFVVNVKDTNKVTFLRDTWTQLEAAGFVIVEHVEVGVRGLNHGSNHEKKKGQEDIVVTMKPPTKRRRVKFPAHRILNPNPQVEVDPTS